MGSGMHMIYIYIHTYIYIYTVYICIYRLKMGVGELTCVYTNKQNITEHLLGWNGFPGKPTDSE